MTAIEGRVLSSGRPLILSSPTTATVSLARSSFRGSPARRDPPLGLGPSKFRISAVAVEKTETEEIKQLYYNNKTYYPKKIDTDGVTKPWFLVDAEGQTLGRMATLIAVLIRGKLNPAYTPSMDMGAFVIVTNADKVTVSGNKYNNKIYYRHTVGRPGKLKAESFRALQNRLPERIVEKAVKGMLPKGRLGRKVFHHLKVYAGDGHPHAAQQPLDVTALIDAKASAYPEILARKKQQGA